MQLTVVEIDNKKLFDGAKVRKKGSEQIRTIKVIPEDKSLYECCCDGSFDPNNNVDYDTVMNNKHLFELIDETE